jgi:hypothetical protein
MLVPQKLMMRKIQRFLGKTRAGFPTPMIAYSGIFSE